jgi:probable phosphoglycerate mutase
MKLYFVRHGESEANTQHVISNRESPFRLTPLGKQQVITLAEKLKNIPFSAIFSSPVLRARETADILSESFHLPYQVTEALREYDCGILEEKSDAESWKLHREIAEDWTLNHNYQRRPEAGECFLDIQNRFLPLIESLKHRKEDHILLIGHGGLFQLMLPLVLRNIDHDFVRSHGIGHTACVIAELSCDGLICRQWGDIQFESFSQ